MEMFDDQSVDLFGEVSNHSGYQWLILSQKYAKIHSETGWTFRGFFIFWLFLSIFFYFQGYIHLYIIY